MTGLEEAFEATLAPPGSAADAARREAFERFRDGGGWPTTRVESWRYTDLRPIREGDFDFASPAPSPEAIAGVAALLSEAGLCGAGEPCAVLVDGHYAASLSRTHEAAPLALRPSAARAVPRPARDAGGPAPADHPLAALNAAFAREAMAITVPAGEIVAAPLHLVVAGSGTCKLAVHPRIAIELGHGAKLTVITHFLDAPDASGWLNAVLEITQGEASELTLYGLQEHGAAQLHTSLVTAELRDGAVLTGGFLDTGGRLVRRDLDVRLAAPGARADLYGVSLAFEGQHVDNHVRIDHAAPATFSDENFRAIIGYRGRGVFNGKVVVHRDAQGIDARQRSDNLLLSEQAEIDTKPELEIYADNVKCSHGATVGELDEEQLFYLRARGLDESAARGLLTFAFANAIIERIPLPDLRSRIASRVAARLPGHERWEELS